MLYVNNEKVLSLDMQNVFIVFDFDRTITNYNSNTSWGILEQGISNEEYIKSSKALYDYYRKIEISNIDSQTKSKSMSIWMNKQIELLMKYGINEEVFNKLLDSTSKLIFRSGFDAFINQMNELNVPVIIISAGLGNIIEKSLLEHNCLLDNVTLISNMLKFNNDKIIVDNEINSINKSNIVVPEEFKRKIKDKKDIILFGDQIGDLSMLQNFNFLNNITIGFLTNDTLDKIEEYKNFFDIVAPKDESYHNINKVLIKEKKWK